MLVIVTDGSRKQIAVISPETVQAVRWLLRTEHSERQTDRQTDRERHRERESETDRQTETERKRETDRQTDREFRGPGWSTFKGVKGYMF